MPSNMTLGSGVTWPELERYGGKAILGFLRHRLAKETGTIVLLVGTPGAGKSFTALWIASQLDPTFAVSRVVFDIQGYLGILAAGTGPGQAILLDEAGVSAPARRWYSAKNIALSLTVESVRHRGLLTLVTVPDAGMVDANVRKLAYMVINCRRVDRVNQEVIARPYLIKPNYITGQIYMKNPVTMLTKEGRQGGEPVKWSSVRFGRPPLNLETEYLSKRAAVMDALYKSLADSLNESEPGAPAVEATYWRCLSCGHQWKPRIALPSLCVKCRKPTIEPLKRTVD